MARSANEFHAPLKGAPGKQLIELGGEGTLRIHAAPGYALFLEGLSGAGRGPQLVRIDPGAECDDLIEALREANELAQSGASRA